MPARERLERLRVLYRPGAESRMPQTASSVISRIDYNAPVRELHVTFTSGRRYSYFGVPAEVYYQFCRAASKGEFFNTLIRDRYEFEEHH